jgi:hypothetical protein
MSDLALIKTLNGCAASFARFEGPDKIVVIANGQYHIVTRDHWRALPVYQGSLAIDVMA